MADLDMEAIKDEYHFSKDTLEILSELYGDGLKRVVESLSRPPSRYYLRVNTLRMGVEEVRDRLAGQGIHMRRDPHIGEALYTEVEGPLEVPINPRRVVVDKFTAESVILGAHVYAPGVISSKGVRLGDKVTVVDEMGQPVASGIAHMGEPHILTYRRGLAVEVTHPMFRAPSLRDITEFQEGLIYLQSLPAMVTSRVLDPKPSETIVDFNCSPGGKLSHICQLTRNQGKIIGVDRTKRKIQLAKETLKRMGCVGVSLIVQDSRYLDIDIPRIKVDKCLIDPPCSALGVLPKVYETLRRSEVMSLAEYQKQFLRVASKILKPGGVAVYSICTMTLEECEGVVEFAERNCGFEIASQSPFLGSQGLKVAGGRMLQRFHPHLHGSGYFIARLRKKL